MALHEIPARDIIVEVEDATPNTWLAVAGLRNVVPNPGENAETVDTTKSASAGQYEELVMQRGASMTLEGDELMDPVTGATDPGQARCATLATLVGLDSRGRLRFRYPVQTNWKVWTATFSQGDQNGNHNAVSSFQVTVRRSGASSTMAVA